MSLESEDLIISGSSPDDGLALRKAATADTTASCADVEGHQRERQRSGSGTVVDMVSGLCGEGWQGTGAPDTRGIT
jgi:hypothetical protein